MKYVYMNHRIRMKKPDGPIIVVQEDDQTVEADMFEIMVGGHIIGYVAYDPKGLDACETHDVKAWVGFSNEVELRPVIRDKSEIITTPHEPKPVAAAKEPNSPVELWPGSLAKGPKHSE
jgi:hypothetical protein